MIGVDTNLLVYAHREDSDFNKDAVQALVDLSECGMRWAIPWSCVHEFLAIVTHPRIFDPPSPLVLALQAVESWLASPYCTMIGEEPGYFDNLKELANKGKINGPKIHDARIAAVCIQHGIQELWTADRDFSRFTGLKTRNPLTS